MFYKADSQTADLFLTSLDIMEDIFRKGVTDSIEEYLKRHVTVKPYQVLDVAPQPRQYFSRSRRFLVLAIQANVDRDKQTGRFNSLIPVLNGLFLDDDGNAYQPPLKQSERLPEGQYFFEQISLPNDVKSTVTKLADDQSHNVKISSNEKA